MSEMMSEMMSETQLKRKLQSDIANMGLCGCSMEQPYRANILIIRSVGMLPGASAEYTSLSMNVQHIKRCFHNQNSTENQQKTS